MTVLNSPWAVDPLRVEEKHSYPYRPWRLSKRGTNVIHMQARLLTHGMGWLGNLAACHMGIAIYGEFEKQPERANKRPCGHCLDIARRAGLID